MTQTELPPMAPGGQWMRLSAHTEPIYVVHEAHIKRLFGEGAMPAEDPRDPAKVGQPAPPSSTEAALRAELETLKAQMQAMMAAMQQQPAQDTTVQPEGKEAAPAKSSKAK